MSSKSVPRQHVVGASIHGEWSTQRPPVPRASRTERFSTVFYGAVFIGLLVFACFEPGIGA